MTIKWLLKYVPLRETTSKRSIEVCTYTIPYLIEIIREDFKTLNVYIPGVHLNKWVRQREKIADRYINNRRHQEFLCLAMRGQ